MLRQQLAQEAQVPAQQKQLVCVSSTQQVDKHRPVRQADKRCTVGQVDKHCAVKVADMHRVSRREVSNGIVSAE